MTLWPNVRLCIASTLTHYTIASLCKLRISKMIFHFYTHVTKNAHVIFEYMKDYIINWTTSYVMKALPMMGKQKMRLGKMKKLNLF
jgi:hypothetical protein